MQPCRLGQRADGFERQIHRHLAAQKLEQNAHALRATHPVGVVGAREIAADIADVDAISGVIAKSGAEVIVHAAGLTNVDECERNPREARRLHAEGTRNVAVAAEQTGAKLVYMSTDHLWDGTRAMVTEDTPPYPINVYARTKLEGETIALQAKTRTLSVRTNFFGAGRPWRKSFSDWIIDRLRDGAALNMFADAYFTPIALNHLIRFLVELVEMDACGPINVAGGERLSKFDFAVMLANAAGFSENNIRRASISGFGLAAPRPRDMSLDTSRVASLLGRPMPRAADGIATLFDDSEPGARSLGRS